MKPLWKVKAFEKQTSWKVSVPDCVFLSRENEQKRVTPTCTSLCLCYRDLESVCDTTTTHNDAHKTHTTKHTNKTPITHHKHTAHTHTTHIHRTPSKSKHVRNPKDGELCLMRAHFRGVSGRYWRANRSWHSVQLVSLRIAGVEQFYQVQRMIGGIGNMLFSISPKLQHGQGPSLWWTMMHVTTPHVALNCLIHCLPSVN